MFPKRPMPSAPDEAAALGSNRLSLWREGGCLRFLLPYSMKSGGWHEPHIYDRAAPNAIFYIKR